MTTLSVTNIANGSALESATVNSIFAEIESFFGGSTANADSTITGVSTANQFQTAADGTVAGAAGAVSVGASDDAAILWDGTDVVIDAQSILTATPQYYTLQHTTSGTPAIGIGAGVKAVVETAAGNNEIGGMAEFITTNVTDTTEAFDFVVKLMAAGGAAAEKFRISSAGHLTTTSINLSSSTTISSILDEDDMSSDSATALATQQSIKKYVDDQVATSDSWQEVMTVGDTYYVATNDGNPEIRVGATDAEEYHIQAVYDSGAQTLDYVLFQTDVASATADKGLFKFNVDGTVILDIDDGGINLAASKGISIAGIDIITDSAGTATLSNIDALDATTEATIEAAIDSLPNLTSVGTLTTLTVDDITINGNGISSGGASALTIDALAGQAVTIEGVSIDGGVITGATSITSTSFIGDVTGNVSGTAATVTGAAQTAITSLGTLTAINIASGAGYDINGIEVLNATTLGSAVVNSSLTTVGTLASPTINTPSITGFTDNSAASAGDVGEVISHTNSASSSAAAYVQVATVSLTAGDWEVSGGMVYSGATSSTDIDFAISTTTASSSGTTLGKDRMISAISVTTGNGGGSTPSFRVSLSGTTSYYLNGKAATGSQTLLGHLNARRVR